MEAWRKSFQPSDPLLLALRLGDRLVGLAPWFVHRRPDGQRQITFLGNGVSDRLDALLSPEARAPGAEALWAWLERNGDAWDICDLRDMPHGAALLQVPPWTSLRAAVEPETPCPALPLPSSAEALRRSLPGRLRSNLAYGRRRAEAMGEVRIQTADAGSLARVLEALFELHRARWRERGEEGALAGAERFHREAARAFQAQGWLRLYLMTIGGRPAAVHYGFHVKRRAYFYIGGFDPEFAAVSPGALLLQHAIEQAVEDGCTVFDFLRGQEAYKHRWGAADQPQSRLRISRA